MITFDGERSKSRLWFAKKQIDIIKDIDVPSKGVKWNGFTFRVWQQDDLTGGRITAPMGAVVLVSSRDGIKIAAMENWLGACTSYSDLNILYVNAGRKVILNGDEAEEDLAWQGYRVIRSRPDIMAAFFDIDGTNTKIPDYSCTPSITPYHTSEAYIVTTTDKQFVDLNNNNIPDMPYDHLESTLTGYNSNNGNFTGRRSVILANGPNSGWKTCINLPGNRHISFTEKFYEYNDYGQFVCAFYTHYKKNIETGKTDQIAEDILISDMVPAGSGMPSELRSLMMDIEKSIIRPIGVYAFINSDGKLVLINAAWFANDAITVDGTYAGDTPTEAWFGDHPEHEEWRMFISVMVKDLTEETSTNVVLHSSSQFFSILDDKSINTLLDEDGYYWNGVMAALSYFFSWPNSPGLINIINAWKPHDSIMFHGPDSIYSWTRAAGAVEIATNGIFGTFLVMPPEVDSIEGVRPDISYSGEGLYFCACNELGKKIHAVYYGSPFSGWTKLNDPPGVLMHVRPVVVTGEIIRLIGVVKDTLPDGTEVYRFSCFSKESGGIGKWSLLAILPFEVGAADNFASCLYGDNPMVTSLINFPSPPAATPQNIVGPYSSYAEYRP
jgi:hypothetical protein